MVLAEETSGTIHVEETGAVDYKYLVKSIYPRAGVWKSRHGKSIWFQILQPSTEHRTWNGRHYWSQERLSEPYTQEKYAWIEAWNRIEKEMLRKLGS